ncbi:MAG: DUF2027 domain-containing protein [Bacteroidales bacterium]|nr:DUF2027 domain-containing protein [Bacteroidales bacterium]
MIHVGDTVRFLNEKGEGVVTRIIGNIAYVLIEDGFEIPVKTDQLVCVKKTTEEQRKGNQVIKDEGLKNYNYIERNDEEFNHDSFEIIQNSENEAFELSNDLYLAFVPQTNNNDILHWHLFLINDTTKNFVYTTFIKNNDEYIFIDKGSTESNTKVFLGEIQRETLVQIQKIIVRGILFLDRSSEKSEIIDKEIKVKSLYLLSLEYFKENDFFDEKALILSILNAEKNKEIILNEKIKNEITQNEPIEKRKAELPELIEVDLHIEELVNDYQSLTATEMLNIQINHFRNKLEEAIITPHVKKIVFIHGVGNGTLKLELRRILSREYAHYDYQDASFKEYGYGATMVILRG